MLFTTGYTYGRLTGYRPRHGDLNGRARIVLVALRWRLEDDAHEGALLAAFAVFSRAAPPGPGADGNTTCHPTAPPAATAPAAERPVLLCLRRHLHPPGRPDYVQPAVTADRGWLHSRDASTTRIATPARLVWLQLSVGETVTLEITPMIGAVSGTPLASRRVQGLVELEHAEALQRKRSSSSTRAAQVTASSTPGRNSRWRRRTGAASACRSANEGLRDRLRHPARVLRGRFIQGPGCHRVRVQPRCGPAHCRRGRRSGLLGAGGRRHGAQSPAGTTLSVALPGQHQGLAY